MQAGKELKKLKTWDDVKNEIAINEGYAVIMFTDCFEFERYSSNSVSAEVESMLKNHFDDRLLDMRIFNDSYEYRIFRSDVSGKFHVRIIDDNDPEVSGGIDVKDYFDDKQYLDIDTVRSQNIFKEKNRVRATGGGCYNLPLNNMKDVKVKIRNYIGYDDIGQAYIKDWRLAGFDVPKA